MGYTSPAHAHWPLQSTALPHASRETATAMPSEDIITDSMSDLRHVYADRDIDFERAPWISADHLGAKCELVERMPASESASRSTG